MSDKLRAAAKAALLALKCLDGLECAREEIEALEAALVEPSQETMHPEIKKMYEDYFDKCFRESQRPWVGLTDDEITKLHHEIKTQLMGTYKTEDIYRAIETKLREKNDV